MFYFDMKLRSRGFVEFELGVTRVLLVQMIFLDQWIAHPQIGSAHWPFQYNQEHGAITDPERFWESEEKEKNTRLLEMCT